MKRNQLLMIIMAISITSLSYAQQKIYKCVSNGQIVYSNDEKDSKCKKMEMMELNKFNPSKSPTNSNKELNIKNNVANKENIYPEPIPLDYVPEKPAPIDEKAEQKQYYEQKINKIEQNYLKFLGTLLKIKK